MDSSGQQWKQKHEIPAADRDEYETTASAVPHRIELRSRGTWQKLSDPLYSGLARHGRSLGPKEPSLTQQLTMAPGLDRDQVDSGIIAGARHYWRYGFGNPGFLHWDFDSGMTFGADRTWWVPARDRGFPHEGLDFRTFTTSSGARTLAAGSPVPSLWSGRIERVFRDIIGHTLLMAHDITSHDGRQLHSILAHIEPLSSLKPGVLITASTEIARLAPPPTRINAPSHLHLSLMWLEAGQAAEMHDWKWIERHAGALVDPMPILRELATID